MKTYPRASRLLALSEQVYRALLVLYPAHFRQAYGPHMTQVFRDVCHDVYRHGGNGELLKWWTTTLFDLVQTVIAEHRKVNLTMSQAKFIQWSGWLCMLGGVFFIATSVGQLQPVSGRAIGGLTILSLYALVPGMVLIMLGLVGIYLRYKADLNLFGRFFLFTSFLGAGITAVGWLLTLMDINGFWNIFMLGWLVHLSGHSVFGGFVATTHLLPRWNFALLIGSAMPLTVVVLMLSSQQAPYGPNWAGFAMMVLIGIGWLITGWALNSQPATSIQPATTG